MPEIISYCPRCQQQITVSLNSGDVVHTCTGPTEALINEDVVVIAATAKDDQGVVDTGRLVADVQHQGKQNMIFGTRAAIEGARVHQKTTRGNSKDTFRTRQHYETID